MPLAERRTRSRSPDAHPSQAAGMGRRGTAVPCLQSPRCRGFVLVVFAASVLYGLSAGGASAGGSSSGSSSFSPTFAGATSLDLKNKGIRALHRDLFSGLK